MDVVVRVFMEVMILKSQLAAPNPTYVAVGVTLDLAD